MKNRTPQDEKFNQARCYEKLETYISVFSYLASLIQVCTNIIEPKVFLILSTLFLIALCTIQICKKKTFHEASNLKRRYFFDSSFDTRREPHTNQAFYDNRDVEVGIKRTFANLHENAYFTYKITEKMKLYYILISSTLVVVTFILILWFGLNSVNASLINVILTGTIVKKTVAICTLQKDSYEIFKECNNIASRYQENPQIYCLQSEIIDVLIRYENALCVDQVSLSELVYSNLNQKLTDEWSKHKKNYSIYIMCC